MKLAPKPIHIPNIEPPIPENWSWNRLDSICLGIFDCPHSTPKYTQDGPYVVRSQDVRSGVIDLRDMAHVSEATYEERISRAEPRSGDLVYSREGTYFGIAAEVPDGIQVCLGQRMVLIRPDNKLVNHQYLRYWLNSKVLAGYIAGFKDGSVAERLNLPTIRGLPIPVASNNVQQSIAEILSSLDEKIELNRKQNRTLEAIAQALFKRWFVEFEFPDENGRPYKSSGGAMQPSELGEIPVGWDVGCIGDFVEHSKDGVNPGDRPEDAFYHFSIPNFDDGQTAKAELGSTILSNKFAVVPDSILVSKLNPRFPRIWPVLNLSSELSVCSTEFQVLLPAVDSYGFVLELLRSPYVTSEMVTRASGTSGSHQRINPDDLLSIEIIKPRQVLVEKFHSVVFDGIVKNQANLEHSRNLAKLRDTLLPKLMSGELRVA